MDGQLLDKKGPLVYKLVMLEALHACQQSVRKIQQENGADYLLPVKGNHEALEKLAAACLPPPDPGAKPCGTKPSAVQQPAQPIQQNAELSPSGPSTAVPVQVPLPPCVTAASEDADNRSRYERRSLRWVATTAETLCCHASAFCGGSDP